MATDHDTRAANGPLGATELDLIDAYWRAANYLSVGQIYLLDNPLLREPLAGPITDESLITVYFVAD